MPNNQKFLRSWTLVAVDEALEQGIDLSAFRIKFKITSSTLESPNAASIRVYNLSPDTIQTLVTNGEFTQVVLTAGYKNGNTGQIFRGTIKQFKIGRESNVDSYLDILAGDGDEDYNYAYGQYTLQAGSTPSDRIQAAQKLMPNTAPVYQPSLDGLDGNDQSLSRGKIGFGLVKIMMRQEAKNLDCDWSIQAGKLVYISKTSYPSNEAVVINIQTGLVGIPEQQDDGIKIRSLLDPTIMPGTLVKIDNSEVTQFVIADPVAYNSRLQQQFAASLSKTGVYMALWIDYIGDTRGLEWYNDMTCLALESDVGSPLITPQ